MYVTLSGLAWLDGNKSLGKVVLSHMDSGGKITVTTEIKAPGTELPITMSVDIYAKELLRAVRLLAE